MIDKIRSYSVLLFCLLIVNSSCQRHEEESVYVSVPDKSITPVKYFKHHEIKMKCGRTVKFTLPAEFSDKYPTAGRGYYSGVDFIEQYHCGIKNDSHSIFSILSYELDSVIIDEKQLDVLSIRDETEWILKKDYVVPIIEKKTDNKGQIFYFMYIFAPKESVIVPYMTNIEQISVCCHCSTLYRDTLYSAVLSFNTDKDHFDFPSYRKTMESVQIR